MTKDEIQTLVDSWIDGARVPQYPFEQTIAIVQCNLLLLILDRLEVIASDLDSIEKDIFDSHNQVE